MGVFPFLSGMVALILAVFEAVVARQKARAPVKDAKEITDAIASHDANRAGPVLQRVADRVLRYQAERAAQRQ